MSSVAAFTCGTRPDVVPHVEVRARESIDRRCLRWWPHRVSVARRCRRRRSLDALSCVCGADRRPGRLFVLRSWFPVRALSSCRLSCGVVDLFVGRVRRRLPAACRRFARSGSGTALCGLWRAADGLRPCAGGGCPSRLPGRLDGRLRAWAARPRERRRLRPGPAQRPVRR